MQIKSWLWMGDRPVYGSSPRTALLDGQANKPARKPYFKLKNDRANGSLMGILLRLWTSSSARLWHRCDDGETLGTACDTSFDSR